MSDSHKKSKPNPPEMWYGNIKARQGVPLLVAYFTGNDLVYHTNFDIQELKKNKLPFGQIPYLEDNGVCLAQSGAIARYLAKKWKCDGADNDQDFANANQLIEEYQDIYAHFSRGKREKNLIGVAKTDLPKHFGNLEKLLGSREYFSTKANVGDLAVFFSINMALDVDAHFLESYPNLKGFYHRLAAHKGIKAWLDLNIPVYFKLD